MKYGLGGRFGNHKYGLDTTDPVITVVSVSKTKLSDETGWTESTLAWQVSEICVGWTVRRGGTSETTGVEIDTGGYLTVATPVNTVVYWTDLVEGANQINVYAKDTEGRWVPYMQA